MTRSRWILVGVFAVVGLYVLLRPVEHGPAGKGTEPSDPGQGKAPALPQANVNAGQDDSKEVEEPPSKPTFTGPLPAPNPPSPQRQSPAAPPLPELRRPPATTPDPAQTVVEAIALNLRQYQLRFGGNPVGTNAEIVRELTGGNGKGATYLPSDLKRLNAQGELIDEWGTPYFFHQESAEQMEIRSAGADRILWTSDDLVAR